MIGWVYIPFSRSIWPHGSLSINCQLSINSLPWPWIGSTLFQHSINGLCSSLGIHWTFEGTGEVTYYWSCCNMSVELIKALYNVIFMNMMSMAMMLMTVWNDCIVQGQSPMCYWRTAETFINQYVSFLLMTTQERWWYLRWHYGYYDDDGEDNYDPAGIPVLTGRLMMIVNIFLMIRICEKPKCPADPSGHH